MNKCLQCLILVAVGLSLVSPGGTPRAAHANQAEQPKSDGKAAEHVALVIDYGDGCQKHFTALPWKKGMTVLDAMQAAERHPRGIRIKYRGAGETAFLTQIDDLENEGAGKNWLYRVNDKTANKSFAAWILEPGDSILWRFRGSR